MIVNLGLVPTTDYATPASRENPDAIRNLVGTHDGIILQRHGALTVGRDPWQAFMRMEFMEQAAQVTLILQQLGKGAPLPPDQVQSFWRSVKRWAWRTRAKRKRWPGPGDCRESLLASRPHPPMRNRPSRSARMRNWYH